MMRRFAAFPTSWIFLRNKSVQQFKKRVFQLSSRQLPDRNVSSKTTFKMVQNDPFMKLSLSLCVLIIGGTILMELYNRLKAVVPHTVVMPMPGFSHYAVWRDGLILQLKKKLEELRHQQKHKCPVLHVIGPPGSGKSELVRQFSDYYVKTSQKRYGLKLIAPTVLYLDGTSSYALSCSLAEAFITLGLGEMVSEEKTWSAIVAQLTSTKLPWLIVVDNVKEDVYPRIKSLMTSFPLDTDNHGAILITSQTTSEEEASLFVGPRLEQKQSLVLLETMGRLQATPDEDSKMALLETLQYHPMAVALAAVTIKIQQSLSPSQTPVTTYHKLLLQSMKDCSDVVQSSLNLYVEAALSDSRLRHTFDLLGSCDWKSFVPVSVFPIHLNWELYGIPPESLSPPLEPLLEKVKSLSNEGSYWDSFKSRLPSFQSNASSEAEVAGALAASQDEVSYLRESPIVLFKKCHRSHLEVATIHSVAVPSIAGLFTKVTSQHLDDHHLSKEEKKFQQRAWLKQFRIFDKRKCLHKFHGRLPGVSSHGVLTYHQFVTTPLALNSSTGTFIPYDPSHAQYLHLVSHYHRVVQSLASLLRLLKGEVENLHLKAYLVPHLQAVKGFSLLSEADRTIVDISLVALKAMDSSPDECQACVTRYEEVITRQRELLGSQNHTVALSLVDLADLYLSLHDAHSAKKLLKSALDIYQQISTHVSREKFALDMGHTLSSLGMVYHQLGEAEQSKNFYEQALASCQLVPKHGRVSQQQQKIVASLMVDVTHAYVLLGDLPVSKKYAELAAVMLQTLYPQGHMETVRLFNISSIISALMGDKEASTKYRVEAKKMKDNMYL